MYPVILLRHSPASLYLQHERLGLSQSGCLFDLRLVQGSVLAQVQPDCKQPRHRTEDVLDAELQSADIMVDSMDLVRSPKGKSAELRSRQRVQTYMCSGIVERVS